jgi:hypothetical protein
MPEPNPMAVIADCIEKSKATTDQELIGDYIAEALGVLQIDNTEEDAFNMVGSAIIVTRSLMTKRTPLPCSRSGRTACAAAARVVAPMLQQILGRL